ncbi:MAG: hypothetical protein NVV74_10550 [Magnetospirillum sp.]|nr:hypothetical protein [Magnetospirillum sp.]
MAGRIYITYRLGTSFSMRKKSLSSRAGLGHAAHTQTAAALGLPGTISRRIKLTFLGAGSFFTPRLVNDLVRIPGEKGGTVALVDIDEARLRISARLVRKLLVSLGKSHWKLVASTDRRAVLKGSDYVVNCIEVSGLECVKWDNDIPLKYGVDQCIGDTIGPGGLFKALRTIPVWLDVLKDCEQLCPAALVLNYTNPMAMLCTRSGADFFDAGSRAVSQRPAHERFPGALRRRAGGRTGVGVCRHQSPRMVYETGPRRPRSVS